jgi:hypothetical protein
MGLVAENKPAKELTTARELIEDRTGQTLPEYKDSGLLEIGSARASRHFVS